MRYNFENDPPPQDVRAPPVGKPCLKRNLDAITSTQLAYFQHFWRELWGWIFSFFGHKSLTKALLKL